MHPSLRGIANRAKASKDYRFLNLYTMLNKEFLIDSWRYLNKSAASGVDRISAYEYGKHLEANVIDLVDRLKRKSYKARLVRRQYIPKGKGSYRPLGIPAIEDKLLQTAVARILQAIFEQDFLDFSYGYRPRRGAQEAVKALTFQLQYGWYGYVVEADIKGFFDNIDHDWLCKMLEQRVNDKPFIRLIRKWLRAGVLDTDGKVLHPATGTPQGGIVSPVLANIYLHYVLDMWFEKKVKPQCKGEVYLCRYADDFVCLFQYKAEADRFYRELPRRLSKFNLNLSAEKTRIIRFTKWQMEKSGRFDFLGFEFSWGKDRQGKPHVKRRTSRVKLRKALSGFTHWCKVSRNKRLSQLFSELNRKLTGYYNYYGLKGNSWSLREFWKKAERILFKWLNRRSQRVSYNWRGFRELLKYFKAPLPRITQKDNCQLTLDFNY